MRADSNGTVRADINGTVDKIVWKPSQSEMIDLQRYPELGTLEWWISGLMLNPLFLIISRLI